MSAMQAIINALGKHNGTVNDAVLKVAWHQYPTQGAHKANCAAIAYPVLRAVGAVDYAEGGTVNGEACYVVRRADGAWGAVHYAYATGKGRVWWYDGVRGARKVAWARYRHCRDHEAFMPKQGEQVCSTVDTQANAGEALYALAVTAKPTARFTLAK